MAGVSLEQLGKMTPLGFIKGELYLVGGRWEAEVLCGFGAAGGASLACKASRGRGLALRRKGGKDSWLT